MFVSANDEAWQGDHWQIEVYRCVNEYTDEGIIKRFGALDEAAIEELKKLPCIFAYEAFNKLDPKFGLITDVTKRRGEVRVEYEMISVELFSTSETLANLMFELDIGRWELNRTHWAVKDVDLPKELNRQGIELPS